MNILSCGEQLVDVFSKDLIECKAVGNISSQFEISKSCECSNSRMVLQIYHLNLLHWQFSCGWFGVLVNVFMPISFKYFLMDVYRNPDPLSEYMVLGDPNVANNS